MPRTRQRGGARKCTRSHRRSQPLYAEETVRSAGYAVAGIGAALRRPADWARGLAELEALVELAYGRCDKELQRTLERDAVYAVSVCDGSSDSTAAVQHLCRTVAHHFPKQQGLQLEKAQKQMFVALQRQERKEAVAREEQGDVLGEVPPEVLGQILGYLPARDAARAVCVNRAWHGVLSTDDKVWQAFARGTFCKPYQLRIMQRAAREGAQHGWYRLFGRLAQEDQDAMARWKHNRLLVRRKRLEWRTPFDPAQLHAAGAESLAALLQQERSKMAEYPTPRQVAKHILRESLPDGGDALSDSDSDADSDGSGGPTLNPILPRQ
eukprot:jgi/Tetstr1/428890/TSEL_018869.t1